MSIDKSIPEDFPAGWQAIETGNVQEGDILITSDEFKTWASSAIGGLVESFTNGGPGGDGSFRAVYRRMACPKQEGGDTYGASLRVTDPAALPTSAAQTTSAIITEGTSAVTAADFRYVDKLPDLTPAALPTSAAQRKGIPVYSGFLAYFPKAIAAVAKLSKIGNDQHNPGKPLHWDRSKSGDELDALARHLLDIAEVDTDDTPHEVKVAWRAMANLQKCIETNPGRFEKFFAK